MADKRSNTPIILALLSVVTCCFPLGLVAAAMGWREGAKGRAAGQGMGTANALAIALGLGSTLLSAGVIMAYKRDQAKKAGMQEEILAQVDEAQLTAERLTQDTACAVGRAWLIGQLAVPKAVECAGPLTLAGPIAKLEGLVQEDSKGPTALCLMRINRWFVAGKTASECPTELPALPEGAEQAALESAARAAFTEQLAQLDVSRLLADLSRFTPALEAEVDIDTACPAMEAAQSALVMDAALLPVDGAERPIDLPWAFMNSELVQKAMNTGAKASARQPSALEWFAAKDPYLVLVQPVERSLPVVGDDEGFDGGVIVARLLVVDRASGQVACQAGMAAENSEVVEVGGGVNVGLKIGPKVNIGGTDADDAIFQDFYGQYGKAVQAAVSKASGGKLKARF